MVLVGQHLVSPVELVILAYSIFSIALDEGCKEVGFGRGLAGGPEDSQAKAKFSIGGHPHRPWSWRSLTDPLFPKVSELLGIGAPSTSLFSHETAPCTMSDGSF